MTPEEKERFVRLEQRVDEIASTTRELIQTVKERSELGLQTAQHELRHIHSELEQILRIVRDGNGGEALTLRVRDNRKDIERLQAKLETFYVNRKSMSLETTRGKWALIVALVMGAGAVISQVVELLIK
jgi:DNA repair exonuclease SbcCD ATPase subunit